jgi:dTDP-glucose pyrophosphorylase
MDHLIIKSSTSIRKALEILDGSFTKTLFVTDESSLLLGSLTDGDIRRWILKTNDIKGDAGAACNPSPFVLTHPIDRDHALQQMQKRHLEAAPLVDREGHILSVVLQKSLTGQPSLSPRTLTDIPVVIMAGGKGTRLDPFTRILPKPLIPVGQQPVIEHIMQQFAHHGADTFYITVNHKAGLIKAYFDDQKYPYQISFVEEQQPLGTAGALRMLAGTVEGSVIVSNCDVLVQADYNELLQFHRNGGYALTLVAALHHHAIPYGVCEADEHGMLLNITEKPEYAMLINTGVYLLESNLFDTIPEGEVYHITQLISDLISKDMPVGVFPIPEHSYHDIGQWDTYRNALPFFVDRDQKQQE